MKIYARRQNFFLSDTAVDIGKVPYIKKLQCPECFGNFGIEGALALHIKCRHGSKVEVELATSSKEGDGQVTDNVPPVIVVTDDNIPSSSNANGGSNKRAANAPTKNKFEHLKK